MSSWAVGCLKDQVVILPEALNSRCSLPFPRLCSVVFVLVGPSQFSFLVVLPSLTKINLSWGRRHAGWSSAKRVFLGNGILFKIKCDFRPADLDDRDFWDRRSSRTQMDEARAIGLINLQKQTLYYVPREERYLRRAAIVRHVNFSGIVGV